MIAELRALVSDLGAAVEQLYACLMGEGEALAQRDQARLITITASKTAALSQLEELEQRRRALCNRHQCDPAPAGMPALMAGIEPGGALPAQWDRLRTRLQYCQRLNQSNGLALAALQRRARHSLQLLRGSDQPAGLYGPAGHAISATGPRGLLRA